MIDLSLAVIYPGLNPAKLTDEDLCLKINEIAKRLAFASRSFVNQEVIGQLHNMQNVFITEQSERLERERFALEEASKPKLIETEPDLRQRDLKKEVPVRRDETRKKLHVPVILKSWKNSPKNDK